LYLINKLSIHLPTKLAINIGDIQPIFIMNGPKSPESSGLSSLCSTPMSTQATIDPTEPSETSLSQFDISDIGEKLCNCDFKSRSSIPSFDSQNIKNIVKEALEPLINEIKNLKAEIQ
jgi:hypothetical protein